MPEQERGAEALERYARHPPQVSPRAMDEQHLMQISKSLKTEKLLKALSQTYFGQGKVSDTTYKRQKFRKEN